MPNAYGQGGDERVGSSRCYMGAAEQRHTADNRLQPPIHEYERLANELILFDDWLHLALHLQGQVELHHVNTQKAPFSGISCSPESKNLAFPGPVGLRGEAELATSFYSVCVCVCVCVCH